MLCCIAFGLNILYILGYCVNNVLFFCAARKSELGIAGFGISLTTMEEVFIKVGEGTDETLKHR